MLLLGLITIRIPVLAIAVFSLVFLELMLFAIGLLRLQKKGIFLKALWYLPGFIIMWIKGIFLSFQNLPWLRVRPAAFDDVEERKARVLKSQHAWESWIRNIESQKGVK